MANPDRLMAAGMSADLAGMLGQQTATNLTATGTTYNNAFVLITQNAFFSTVPTGSGCLLPSSTAEPPYTVYNGGANALNVYPTTTQVINGGAPGVPFVLGVGEVAVFTAADNVGWLAVSAGSGLAATPLRYWRKAVANVRSGAGRGTVVVIGDSTSMGAGAGDSGTAALTNAYPYSFPSQLAPLLNATVPTSFQNIFGGQAGAGVLTYTAYDTRVTFGTGWTTSGGATLGSTFFAYTNGSASKLTFTPSASFTRIKVWYYQNTGQGTLTVDVDGGASLGTINTSGSSLYTSQTFTCAAGTHTINLTAGNNGSLFIGGVVVWTAATPAIDLILAGGYGTIASSWAAPTTAFSPRTALQALAPDLTIYDLTINDSNAGTNVAAYKASMELLIQAAQVSGDVVLMVGPPSNTTAATDGTLDLYVQALEQLAATYGCLMLNIKQRWVSYAVTDPILPYYDNLHPERQGYADIAQAASVLLAVN